MLGGAFRRQVLSPISFINARPEVPVLYYYIPPPELGLRPYWGECFDEGKIKSISCIPVSSRFVASLSLPPSPSLATTRRQESRNHNEGAQYFAAQIHFPLATNDDAALQMRRK